jgi:hypothetical protein
VQITLQPVATLYHISGIEWSLVIGQWALVGRIW